MMTGVFISYRREHTAAVVQRLHHRLADRFGGSQIVRDIQAGAPGDDFGRRIDEAVASSAAVLVMISDRWLVDRNPVGKRPIGVPRDWVQREIEVALQRPNVLVIPVLIEGATVPAEQDLPYDIRSLSRRRAMHLSNSGWEDDVRLLIAALDEVVDTSRARAALPSGAQPGPAAAVASDPPPEVPPTRRWFQRG